MKLMKSLRKRMFSVKKAFYRYALSENRPCPCGKINQPSLFLGSGRIRIEISDNGRGFDESKFLSIMKGDEGYGHVGIRNTYLRLTKFYGEENVAILVSSIPYFRSTVTIEVPLMERKED